MPEIKEIDVYNIARTRVDREEVRRWLDSMGADEFDIPPEDTCSDPALLIALAAKQCYMAFQPSLNPNLTRVRTDMVEYLDNVMKSGHGSVLEHSCFTYAINNVTRVFTAEMNRHRAGVGISERSMRFIRFGECIPYWLPDSIRGEEVIDRTSVMQCIGHLEEIADERKEWPKGEERYGSGTTLDFSALTLQQRKQLSREVFAEAFEGQERWYRVLEFLWDMDETDEGFSYKKKVTSMMRRIVGLGVSTGGVWTGNVRALRHIFTMRCEPVAEEEILHVFSKICADMAKKEPMLFGDFEQDENGFWRPKYKKV